MIARGDLGIEIPMEDMPLVQKDLIQHARLHGKLSITATQMLYSMISHQRPTRAEVTDVYNAVIEGSDMIMLSDETAAGQYPVLALEAMVKIARKAEELRQVPPA